MKKLILSVVFALCIAASVLSQPLAVNFGGGLDYTMPKNNDMVRLIGGDSRSMFAIRIDDKDQLYLDQFDANSMMQSSTSPLTIPSVDGIQGKLVDLFFIDGKLILFTEVLNNTRKEKTLYAQFIDDRGKIMGETEPIGRLLK